MIVTGTGSGSPEVYKMDPAQARDIKLGVHVEGHLGVEYTVNLVSVGSVLYTLNLLNVPLTKLQLVVLPWILFYVCT